MVTTLVRVENTEESVVRFCLAGTPVTEMSERRRVFGVPAGCDGQEVGQIRFERKIRIARADVGS